MQLLPLRVICAFCCLYLAIACSQLHAQTFPDRPLTYVVPYPPGGAADVFARQLAQKLGERLGRPVIVENRPGANGNIGSDYVAKGPADGYTILLGSASTITINPHLYGRNMPYDPIKDLQPVSSTHEMANVLVVAAATPFRSVADVIAAAKLKPSRSPTLQRATATPCILRVNSSRCRRTLTCCTFLIRAVHPH